MPLLSTVKLISKISNTDCCLSVRCLKLSVLLNLL